MIKFRTLAVLTVLTLVAIFVPAASNKVAADSPATPVPTLSATNQRINTVPWGDSWGSIAVYCTDPADNPSGIQILNPSGNILFSASNTAVAAAIKQSTTAQPITISQGTNPTYTLTVNNDGTYEITTSPDREGKTFVASWSPECTPVGPNPTSKATPPPTS